MSEIYDAIDWLIVFEDADINPMPFTDEAVARKAYEMKSQNWNCHLFFRVSSESGIDYPKTKIQKLQAQKDALVARVARLESCLVECISPLSCVEPYIADACHLALNETESESLAHIQAAAVENSLTWLSKNYPNACQPACGLIQQYANQLRQQGKDHD